jgi:Ion channel
LSAHELAGTKDRAAALLHGTRPRHSCRVSTILAIQIVLGLLIGFVEGWSVGDTVYFTFVTGLTIGYGDIVPRQALARALAIGIGISGLFLTGLIAGIAVYAMRTALIEDRRTD